MPLTVELKVDLFKHTLDGTLIREGSKFNVEECEDDWTLPGEIVPLYRIVDGEYEGKLLHRYYCKVLPKAVESNE